VPSLPIRPAWLCGLSPGGCRRIASDNSLGDPFCSRVNVTRANHHAATGDQTFTLAGARVKFHHGVDPTAPAPGSRVKLHGKVTKLSKHCPTEGFTPTITVKKVDIAQPKHRKG
jgi:hypothetical protein